MYRYLAYASRLANRPFTGYDDLYAWSIADIESFWGSIWQFSGINHSQPYSHVLSERIMPGARWFEGTRLNFARNLLRFEDDHPALIGKREGATIARLSYRELHRQVAKCAEGLRTLGVAPGDRVAAYLPNVVETVITMLAATGIGAVFSSCSPDFGLAGVLDRFGQIAPKVLVTCDGYVYQGKLVALAERIRHLADRISEIEAIVVVPVLGETEHQTIPGAMRWAELLDNETAHVPFLELPFDHPVYILYSSGTTGAPKCIVHGAGGTLLQHYKELALHTDLRRDDVILYYTTCGWMMWNWLVSSLMLGATVVLYDGSPAYPGLEVLWREIERERITVFGTSPKFLTACQQARLSPRDQFDLASLKTVLSTGAPLSAENFDWVYGEVKKDLQLSSISGGTDIVSCFMLGNPLLPVYSEEIQCRGLGMKVEAFDEHGRPVIGRTGELVCTAPFPSMPVRFWNDPDGSAYRSAYFDSYPNAWRHGDFVRITERGSVIVFGRSDATLNPGGVRIGTAEIYNPVEAIAEIADSIVIAQRWRGDARIVLFVVLAPGVELDDPLRERIRAAIRDHATPRHVPALILAINEIPRTLNGKKVEVAVTRVIHGEPVANRESLVNPHCLEQFRNLPELAADHK